MQRGEQLQIPHCQSRNLYKAFAAQNLLCIFYVSLCVKYIETKVITDSSQEMNLHVH